MTEKGTNEQMSTTNLFPPTREEGLRRLSAFVPRAGREYAQTRNADLGPDRRSPDQQSNVSLLSPYLRYRLMTEHEVVATTLAQHRFADAEKYVQEVLWRTYWKGWLEMRPAVWQRFVSERDSVRAGFRGTRDLASAEHGTTGIEGFDDWARELVETGYLHNHARMWFASIWVFTLRLPWTLGADFFMRHLVDADPASNTLSWRWVAGLQTVGKTYLATADNIARYTDGRFSPKGLATSAMPLVEAPIPAPSPLPDVEDRDRDAPSLLLVTPEDMNPETVFAQTTPFKGALIVSDLPGGGETSRAFVTGAAADTARRVEAHFGCPARIIGALDPELIGAAARDMNVSKVATPYAPVGPLADAVASAAVSLRQSGVALVQLRRPWDALFWPHARKGFFAFKEKIPAILEQEGVC